MNSQDAIGQQRMEYWRKVYRNPNLMPWQISHLDGMTWWRKAVAWILWHVGEVLIKAGNLRFIE